MGIRSIIKKSKLITDLYYGIEKKRKITNKYYFEDRSEKRKYLCIVLAGYKSYVWEDVFGRIKLYSRDEDEVDICVVSSGVKCAQLIDICQNNGWSYLCTYRNNVCIAQNTAINIFKSAELIFKIDEDIFITKDFFRNMIRAYEHAKGGQYNPGVIAPLIPLNAYGHVRILEKLGLDSEYNELFEKPMYIAGPHRQIESNPAVAKYFWGETFEVDRLNDSFSSEPVFEAPCSIRFSIGAILFPREIWEDMGWFPVERKGVGLGLDEVHICSYCCIKSRPIMVSENIVVGHLGFGPQNKEIKDYYLNHRTLFSMRDSQ